MSLTVPFKSYHFASHEEASLHSMLREVDAHTVLVPISSPRTDLYLQEDTGRTANGYVYTDNSFAQMCSFVSPGLGILVNDISGQYRKAGEEKQFFSGELAIRMLNELIKLRYERKLGGLQIVRNTQDKTIDGIVGAKYRYLANSELLSSLTQMLNKAHKFHEAFLYGRQLVVRYIDTTKSYTLSNEEFTSGFHFGNSEIGEKSLRAAAVLVRKLTGNCILYPFKGDEGARIIHTGKDFEKRFYTLIDTIVNATLSPDDLQKYDAQICGKSLKLGKDDHQRRAKQLAQILSRKTLTNEFTTKVVTSAIVQGRDIKSTMIDALPSEQTQIMASRTVFDLIVALIREATLLNIAHREFAENLAYKLLLGWVDV